MTVSGLPFWTHFITTMLPLIEKLNLFSVVLASQSPRRTELLKNLGLTFQTFSPEIDEEDHNLHHSPAELVCTLSVRKAEKARDRFQHHLIIASDTTVVSEGKILNKPGSQQEAALMLNSLSGKTHSVLTGFAVLLPGNDEPFTGFSETRVTFSSLSHNEIEAYVVTGSPLDKAGAYGIQDGMVSAFISGIDGDFYTVMGFPVNAFYLKMKSILL